MEEHNEGSKCQAEERRMFTMKGKDMISEGNVRQLKWEQYCNTIIFNWKKNI